MFFPRHCVENEPLLDLCRSICADECFYLLPFIRSCERFLQSLTPTAQTVYHLTKCSSVMSILGQKESGRVLNCCLSRIHQNLSTRWIVRVQTGSNRCEDSSKGAREGGQECASKKGKNGGRVKFAVAQFWADPEVVISRAFFLFFPCNHIINIKKHFSFSGEVKDSVFFLFLFLLNKLHKPILPPLKTSSL